jgi:hypothetical protein
MKARHWPGFLRRYKNLCAILLIANYSINTGANGQNYPSNSGSASTARCIPRNLFIELPEGMAGTQTDTYGNTTVALGAYERVSPDGRYILRSYSGARLGEVSLIELSPEGKVLRIIPTPLKNEAFPVQGSWRYLVDTNGDHYTFDSILNSVDRGGAPIASKKPSPVFRGGMNGFYAAAAELPSSKPGHVLIRSLSWPNASGDSQSQGEGALASRTLEVDIQNHRITADSGTIFHCTDRIKQDGSLYALPMISVDGTEFAALPQTPVQGQQTMRIFGFGKQFNGQGCEARANFNFSSGKTIFGFSNPQGNSPSSAQSSAHLSWEYQGQVWWYHRQRQQAFNIAPFDILDNGQVRRTGAPYEILASAFPGITQDGRVIYGATLKDCTSGNCRMRAGYVVSDPWQSHAYAAAAPASLAAGSCIRAPKP